MVTRIDLWRSATQKGLSYNVTITQGLNNSIKYLVPYNCAEIFTLEIIETNKVKKEHYLMRQNNTAYKYSIKLSFSSIGQDKSKLQIQISKLLILIAMATW